MHNNIGGWTNVIVSTYIKYRIVMKYVDIFIYFLHVEYVSGRIHKIEWAQL